MLGALAVIDRQLTLGTMLAINALAIGLLVAAVDAWSSSALQLQLLGSYIERIDDVLRTAPEQTRPGRRARAAG